LFDFFPFDLLLTKRETSYKINLKLLLLGSMLYYFLRSLFTKIENKLCRFSKVFFLKRPSLLRIFVNYGRKNVYSIETLGSISYNFLRQKYKKKRNKLSSLNNEKYFLFIKRHSLLRFYVNYSRKKTI